MKPLKIVFIVLGGLFGLGLLLVIVGLIPAVQTWAVRKAVADQPGIEIEFGQLSAGFSAAKLSDVRVTQDGTVLSLKSVDVQYSAWDYLTKGQLIVNRLNLAGVEIDLRHAGPVPANALESKPGSPSAGAGTAASSGAALGASSPFAGLLNAAELPVHMMLAQLSAEGKTLLPEGREVLFDVQGGDIGSGRTGTLKWTTTYRDPLAGAAVESVRNEGSMTIRISSDQGIEHLEIDALTSLIGPTLPSDRVRSQVTAEAASGGEIYAASVSLLRGPSATATVEKLLSAEGAFDPATKVIQGSWELMMRSEQLGAILASLGLPDLDLNGKGQFVFAPDTLSASVGGNLNVGIARLEAISPELTAIGAVQVNLSFEGAMEGDLVSLTRLEMQASDSIQLKFAEVRLLQALGFSQRDQRVEVTDPQSALARVVLKDVPLAWAQPWLAEQRLESGTLSMALTVAAEADGKKIRVLAVEPLTLRAVTVSQGDQKLVDRLELSVHPKIDYTAELITAELADLVISMPSGDSASGRVQVEINEPLSHPVITFVTEFDARLVTALKPFLPTALGPLTIATETQGSWRDDTMLQLTRADVKVDRDGVKSSVAAINLLQAMRVNLDTMTWQTDEATKPTARIELGELPLAWAEAFVADAKLGGSVTGGVLEVVLTAMDDVSVTTTQPITLRGVSATLAGQPQVKDLDTMMDFSADLRGEVVTYTMRRLGIAATGGGDLVALSATGTLGLGEKFTLVAKGNLEADVAGLAKQPALASLVVAEQGRVAATFDASVQDTVINAKVNATLRNFVSLPDKVKLADVDLALAATIDASGKGKVELPLTVGAGKNRSDVLLSGVFTLPPAPAKAAAAATGATVPISFEGSITSTVLRVDDLKAFAALMPASEAPAASVKSAVAGLGRTIGDRLSAAAGAAMNVTAGALAPERDSQPFWQGLTGRVTLDLKEVHYGTDTVISNLRGAAKISPTEIAVDRIEGLMKQEPLKVNGGITFDARAAKPYALNGKVDVKGVAVGPLLQPANLKERPQLEATVGVDADVKGQGGTLPELLKNTYGVFDVNGTDGVLRMLGKRGETISKVSAVIGFLGALRGSESTLAASELASAFSELKFDQFKLRVERGADLSMKFSTIEFISPILRLSGSGGLAAKEGAELENQPMSIVLTMGGKGTMAQLLGKAGMLSGETDAEGYSLISQKFSVGGTPTNPDSSALWRLIAEAGLRAAAGFRSN